MRPASSSVADAAVGVAVAAVVLEQKLPDRLADGERVGVVGLRGLDEIVDEAVVGKPARELVRRRDRVHAGLEIERVDEVAD